MPGFGRSTREPTDAGRSTSRNCDGGSHAVPGGTRSWRRQSNRSRTPSSACAARKEAKHGMVRSERRHEGTHLRLVLDQPKGNIISRELMADLRQALGEVARSPAIKLVTIEGAGDHFSYGASVEEHRSEIILSALPELHSVIRGLLDVPAPTAAVVRGRCLGGGFEIALACDL